MKDIKDSSDESENLNNLLKLSACYFLFKILTNKDIYDEQLYMEKIDEIFNKILINKVYYYNILVYLENLKKIYMEIVRV